MSSEIPYYFEIDRLEATSILRGRETGSFLVRRNKENNHILSISYRDRAIHYVIFYDAETSLYHVADDGNTAFQSIIDLCQHHVENIGILKTKLTSPVMSTNTENVYSDPPEAADKHLYSTSISSPTYLVPLGPSETQSPVEEGSYLIPTLPTGNSESTSSTAGTRNSADGDNSHENCDWFHGKISEDDSFKRLCKMYKSHRLNGIFLVRTSGGGGHVLELISNKKILKYKIFLNSANKYCIAEDGRSFPVLKELIDFLRVQGTSITGLKCELSLLCPKEKKSKSAAGNDSSSSPHRNIKRKDIKLKEILGRGEFGEVRKASWKTGSKKICCAVKMLNSRDLKGRSELEKESKIMTDLQNANIVKLLGLFQDTEGMLLLLEFMPGGSLKTYLDRSEENLPEGQIHNIMLNICSGMMYLAKKSIVHRDLAARNVLLDEDRAIAKIADFGMARLINEGFYVQLDNKKGPIKWYAPECLESSSYTEKSDVWSFGVTMWETYSCGKTPYNERDPRTMAAFLLAGNRLPKPHGCSDKMYSIMNSCWKLEPNDRPTFIDIYPLL